MAYWENIAVSKFAGSNGLGQKLIDRVIGTDIIGEVLGVGTGAQTAFSGTAANSPIALGLFEITYTVGATVYTATDNGAGYIIGTHIDGTTSTLVNSTGVWVLNFTTAPDNATNITVDYTHGQPGEDWKLISVVCRASRKFNDGLPQGNGWNITASNSTGNTLHSSVDGAQVTFAGTLPDNGVANSVPAYGAIEIEHTLSTVVNTAYDTPADDGINGTFSGTNVASGTINYNTRAYSITYSVAPDEFSDVDCDFYYHNYQDINTREWVLYSRGHSGQETILVGFKEIYLLPNYYAWYFNGYLDYTNPTHPKAWWDNGPSLAWVANSIPQTAFHDNNMTFSLYSSRQRIVGEIETTSGIIQSFHVGFGNRMGRPEDYRYPLYIAGDNTTIQVHNYNYRHSFMTNANCNGWAFDPANTPVGRQGQYTLAGLEKQIKTNFGDMGSPTYPAQNTEIGNDVVPSIVYLYNSVTKVNYMSLENIVIVPTKDLLLGDDFTVDGDTYTVYHNRTYTNWNDYYGIKQE